MRNMDVDAMTVEGQQRSTPALGELLENPNGIRTSDLRDMGPASYLTAPRCRPSSR